VTPLRRAGIFRRGAVALIGVAAVAALAMGVGTSGAGRSRRAAAAPAGGDAIQAAFYADVRGAVSPLLAQLKSLDALLAGPAPTRGDDLVNVAGGWADQFAAAAAAVGRLRPPAVQGAPEAQRLYLSAVLAYVEVTRGLAGGADFAAVKRIRALGDSLFDAGRRLLLPPLAQEGPIAVERPLPPPVPAYAAVDGDAAGDAPVVAGWARLHAADLADADAARQGSAAWSAGAPVEPATAGAPAAGRSPVDAGTAGSVADELVDVSRRLGADVPAVGPVREGANVARLGLLVTAESLRALASGGAEAAAAAGRLRVIGDDLSAVATELLGAAR
jgi:hypothetical protein